MFKLKVLSQVIAATAAASFLVGCGSGSSSGSDTSGTSDTTEISGSVFASYVAGAQLVVTDGVNKIAGPVKTDAMGGFKVSIANAQLANNLFFEATGGTYTDEATSTKAVSSERLAVFAAANSLKAKKAVNATPASSIIEQLIAKHGLSEEKAKEFFEKAFGYVPDTSVVPVDATKKNDDASDDAKLAGVRAAAFSQLLLNMELEPGDHKAFLDVLAEDLIDGDMDGMNGDAAVQFDGDNIRHDMAAQFSLALMNFAKSGQNKSGLNSGNVGLINFVSKAESEDYYYELTPKGMVKEGKVTFDLTITDPATEGSPSSPIEGLQPKMMPMMYMAGGHTHSTPHTNCTVTRENGVAECTAYFLMPSMMGNGDVMGNWDLKFTVDGENEVHFFPKVMMAMGEDTSKLMLMGDKTDSDALDDGKGNLTSRSYFIYKDSVMAMADKHTVKFFVATKDSMKSFPALSELDSESRTVELKVNNTAATSIENGVWSFNVSDMTDGEQATLKLNLTVGGEHKMLNGSADAAFKLTPSSTPMAMPADMPMNGSM